jgi:hypothetical protein
MSKRLTTLFIVQVFQNRLERGYFCTHDIEAAREFVQTHGGEVLEYTLNRALRPEDFIWPTRLCPAGEVGKLDRVPDPECRFPEESWREIDCLFWHKEEPC